MNEIQIREGSNIISSVVPAGDILVVVEHVQSIVRNTMIESIDGDYAIIPGTRKKTLLKPGAEKLLMAFGLVSSTRSPQITKLPENHREVIVETEIRSALTGNLLAVGVGSCSTLESKYRYRPGPIYFTGKPVPKEYWNKRKSNPHAAQELLGGKGFMPKKNDQGLYEIAHAGNTIENPDPADQWNTVLKMAAKRSMIDGTLRATMSSAMFTQDMEDFTGNGIKENKENIVKKYIDIILEFDQDSKLTSWWTITYKTIKSELGDDPEGRGGGPEYKRIYAAMIKHKEALTTPPSITNSEPKPMKIAGIDDIPDDITVDQEPLPIPISDFALEENEVICPVDDTIRNTGDCVRDCPKVQTCEALGQSEDKMPFATKINVGTVLR